MYVKEMAINTDYEDMLMLRHDDEGGGWCRDGCLIL